MRTLRDGGTGRRSSRPVFGDRRTKYSSHWPQSAAASATRRGGFTLVEVLAALVLLAIVLPAAMHGISLASSMASEARQRAEAAVLAGSKLDEIVAAGLWQNAALSGDFDNLPDYRWSAEILDWDDSTVKQLNVHVTWMSRGKPQTVTVTTLLETSN